MRAHRGREPYLEYGIDEKGVGVGENEQGGVDAGGVFEALNTALHGGVLEASGTGKARGGGTHKGDLAEGAFDVGPAHAPFFLGQLAQTFGAVKKGRQS